MAVWRLMTHHDDPAYALSWSRKEGRIALGWGRVGDIREGYGSRREVAQAVKKFFADRNNSVEGGHCLWNFCHDVKEGDLVILNTPGRRELVVEVDGPYEWIPKEEALPLGNYQHQRKVHIRSDLNADQLWKQAGGRAADGWSIRWALVKVGQE